MPNELGSTFRSIQPPDIQRALQDRPKLKDALGGIGDLITFIDNAKDPAPNPLATGSSNRPTSMKNAPVSQFAKQVKKAPDPPSLGIKQSQEISLESKPSSRGKGQVTPAYDMAENRHSTDLDVESELDDSNLVEERKPDPKNNPLLNDDPGNDPKGQKPGPKRPSGNVIRPKDMPSSTGGGNATQRVSSDDEDSSTDDEEESLSNKSPDRPEPARKSKVPLGNDVRLDNKTDPIDQRQNERSKKSAKKRRIQKYKKTPPQVLQERIVPKKASKQLSPSKRASQRAQSRNSIDPKSSFAANDEMGQGPLLGIVTEVGLLGEGVAVTNTDIPTLQQHGQASAARWWTGPAQLIAVGAGVGTALFKSVRYGYRRVKLRSIRKEIKQLEKTGDDKGRVAKLRLLENDLKEQTKAATSGNALEVFAGVGAGLAAAKVTLKGIIVGKAANFGTTLKSIFTDKALAVGQAATKLGTVTGVLGVAAGLAFAPAFAVSAYKSWKQARADHKLIKQWRTPGAAPTDVIKDQGGDSSTVHRVAKLVETKVRKSRLNQAVQCVADTINTIGAATSGIIGILTLTSTIAGAPVVLPVLAGLGSAAALGYMAYRIGRWATSAKSKGQLRQARNDITEALETLDPNDQSRTAKFVNNDAVRAMVDDFNRKRVGGSPLVAGSLNREELQRLQAHVNMQLTERDTRTATRAIYEQLKAQPPRVSDYTNGVNLQPAARLLKELGVAYEDIKRIVDSDDPIRAQNALAKCLRLV